MKLPFICPALATTIFSLSSLAFASTYQSEIDLHYLENDVDDYSDEASAIELEGTYYFAPVDTTNVPFAEAAFLRKANSVSLRLMRQEYETPYSDGKNYQRGVDVNYFVPDTMFYMGAGIHQYKNDYSYSYYDPVYGYNEGNYESEWESTWVGRVGVTPIDGLLVWSEFYEHQDLSEYWNLNAKYVKTLANNRAIGIESSFAQSNDFDSHILDIAADYYFTQAFSIGAGVSIDDSDSANGLIRSRYFLTDKISMDISYTDGEYFDTWRAGGSIRF